MSIFKKAKLPKTLSIGQEVRIDTGFVRDATIMEDDDNGNLYFYVHSCHYNGTDYMGYERPFEEKIIVA